MDTRRFGNGMETLCSLIRAQTRLPIIRTIFPVSRSARFPKIISLHEGYCRSYATCPRAHRGFNHNALLAMPDLEPDLKKNEGLHKFYKVGS